MKSYFPPVHQVAALLIAAVTALTLGLRAAEATPCKRAGATCPTNRSCCSGLCLGAKSGGRNHVTGVCAVAQGGPCTGDGECASGRCVDGVCCDTACTAPCHGCSAAKTGGTNGTCAPDTAGTACNDGKFCTTTDACDSSGNCVGSGNPCPLPGQSTICSTCQEATDSRAQSEGLTCGLGNGQACSASFQCTSGFCVDFVCCDAACDGTCEACTKANTGADDGTCEFVSAGLDPNEQCPTGTCLTGSCDGAGACGKVPVGDDPNGDCPPGQCVTGSCDGAGACGVLADTTHCNDGMFCSQTDHCDGAGHCVGGSNNGCPMDCFCEPGDTCLQEGQPCPGVVGGP